MKTTQKKNKVKGEQDIPSKLIKPTFLFHSFQPSVPISNITVILFYLHGALVTEVVILCTIVFLIQCQSFTLSLAF